MANIMYNKAKEAIMTASVDWVNDDIRLLIVDTSVYTINVDTDEFVSDIPNGAIKVVAPSSLTNKTCVLGVCDADDYTIYGATANNASAIVVYVYTGDISSSRLLLFIDSALGLPFDISSVDVLIQWPTGDNKIFVI